MLVLWAVLAAAVISVSAAPDYTTSISPFKRLNGIWYYYMPVNTGIMLSVQRTIGIVYDHRNAPIIATVAIIMEAAAATVI